MPGLLGQLHALIDRGARRNAIQMQQLKCPIRSAIRISASSFAFGRLAAADNLLVQQNLPAQHAQHQRRGQVAVRRRER